MASECVAPGPGQASDRIPGAPGHADDLHCRRADCDTVWGDAGTAEPFLRRGGEHFYLLCVFCSAARQFGVWFRRRVAAVAGGLAAKPVFRRIRIALNRTNQVMTDELPKLKSRLERLELLYQVSNVIHSTLEAQEALQLIVS